MFGLSEALLPCRLIKILHLTGYIGALIETQKKVIYDLV